MGIDLGIYKAIRVDSKIKEKEGPERKTPTIKRKKWEKKKKTIQTTRERMHASLAVSVLSSLEGRQTPQMPLRACSKSTCLTRVRAIHPDYQPVRLGSSSTTVTNMMDLYPACPSAIKISRFSRTTGYWFTNWHTPVT